MSVCCRGVWPLKDVCARPCIQPCLVACVIVEGKQCAQAHGVHLYLVACVAAALIANKSKEITRLNSVYNNLLKNAGVDYLEGKGSLVDAHTVKVGPHTCCT
jgi:pyruvate/2-oxoglutarate dehydrogenase complex dihydrolipoamide dehydrogenase (E3) component